MTTVRLPERWIQRLTQMPESGMGYQRVNILLKKGKILRDIVVLNAEEAQAPEPFETSDILDVQLTR
jgi:hypothetical protein